MCFRKVCHLSELQPTQQGYRINISDAAQDWCRSLLRFSSYPFLLFLPSFLSFLSPLLPSFLHSFLPSFLHSFIHSFLFFHHRSQFWDYVFLSLDLIFILVSMFRLSSWQIIYDMFTLTPDERVPFLRGHIDLVSALPGLFETLTDLWNFMLVCAGHSLIRISRQQNNWKQLQCYQRKFEGLTSALQILKKSINRYHKDLTAKRSHSQEGSLARKLLRTRASASNRPLSLLEGSLERKLRFHILNFKVLREVWHESFVFTSSTFRFWWTYLTKASFSHLPLWLFEGSLAQKLRFHIFHFQILRTSRTKALFWHPQLSRFVGSLARTLRFHIFSLQFLREVSHESFVFTSSTFIFWWKSRTQASFSHLQLSAFEGSLARNAFLRDSRCTKCCVLQDKTCLGRWMGKLVRRTVAEHLRLNGDHSRIGPAVELTVRASFSPLELSKFEGSLARKLRFHICHFQILMDVSYESFVFASSTLTFWGKSCTKASFSHLPLSDFEDVSYESFVLTSSTFTFCGKSRAHASFSHLQLSAFQGSLARNAFLRDSRCTKCCVLQDKTSRNMDGEACLADGCGTRSFEPGSFPDRPCSGTDSSGVVLPTFLRVIPLCLATQSLKVAVELTVQASFCRCSCAAGQRKSGWWFQPLWKY